MDSGKQTTFGAIVERKPKPQANDDTDSVLRRLMQDEPARREVMQDLHQKHQQSHIKPALHLNNNHTVDPPLPSPYSFSDPVNDQPDLETGLAYYEDVQPHNAAPAEPHVQHALQDYQMQLMLLEQQNKKRLMQQNRAPSPMLGEIHNDEDIHAHNSLPTIMTTSATPPLAKPSTPKAVYTPSTLTPSPSSTTEKTPVVTIITNRAGGPPLTMWPTQTDLKAKAKAEKRKRSCNPLMRLSKRNRIIVSVVIALTVIGGAVGVGVGVSRAYHGEVWAGNGKTKPIGDAH